LTDDGSSFSGFTDPIVARKNFDSRSFNDEAASRMNSTMPFCAANESGFKLKSHPPEHSLSFAKLASELSLSWQDLQVF
jgi:hypothetical protein